MFRKAEVWVSAILYIMIITVVLVIVLNAGVPMLEEMKDKTVFTRSKNTFLALNEQIIDVSEEGTGSQRVVPIEIEKGSLELNDGALKWNMRTDAKILESGQQIELGNLYITSNADVSARSYTSNYTLENTYLTAGFTKCEDRSVCTFNQTGMLKTLIFKNTETGTQTTASQLFQVDFGSGSWSYPGYSVLQDSGTDLGAARVLYYINNTNASYYTIIEFSLETNRDFIEVRIR
jgi:hypothetical protein